MVFKAYEPGAFELEGAEQAHRDARLPGETSSQLALHDVTAVQVPRLAPFDRASSLEPRATVFPSVRRAGAKEALLAFARRAIAERNLYGTLAFAESAESLRLCKTALAVGPSDRVLAVTSSGDVILSLLADAPEAILGIDANPAQTALAELKLAAIRSFDPAQYLAFFGLTEASADERIDAFDRASRGISGASRGLLVDRRSLVGDGLLNHGMTHLIICAVARSLEAIMDEDASEAFFGSSATVAERRARLDLLERTSLVRFVLQPALRSLARYLEWLFFPHQLCRVSDRPTEMIANFFSTFRPLFEHGAKDNPVVCRAATGRIHPEWTSMLYRDDIFAKIRANAARLSLKTTGIIDGLSALPTGWATRVYLSNVPDYLNAAELELLASELRRVGVPGARVLYFSLCADDRFSDVLGPRVSSAEEAAIRAHDNVHLYPSIVVRTIAEPAWP